MPIAFASVFCAQKTTGRGRRQAKSLLAKKNQTRQTCFGFGSRASASRISFENGDSLASIGINGLHVGGISRTAYPRRASHHRQNRSIVFFMASPQLES
jgi:hypothetical protein